ncbi:TylF/MycF family methyltransferase [Paenibacillus sp. NPDC058071]|uniref:TylF/MycF family methyltransferase n=1 Tax=Paenibacillus sp. NPDC058071 TaxID=3346326 RepID=UPI0036DC5AF7
MAHNEAAEHYLELLKKTILFEIWLEHEGGLATPHNRKLGLDWPNIAHSMIGRVRMNQLHAAMDTVLEENIPGDFIETGVWRGGACIFMRGFLRAHGVGDRKVYVADSFQGLPEPDPNYPIDATSTFHLQPFLRVSLPEVMDNFKKYDLLDNQVSFLKGWFKDTLPVAPIKQIAVARLDGDMYSSTMDSLRSLYAKVSIGGFIIIDDYSIGYCSAAVHDFRAALGITDPIYPIDDTGVYWRKSK